MAESLIETLSGDFDPTQYTDDYREALRAAHRRQGRGPRGRRAAGRGRTTAGTVVDLMAALRASVEAAKKGRGEADEEQQPAKKTPAKKAPAKKTAAKAPAKKTTAKKAPAKKAAAKKSA